MRIDLHMHSTFSDGLKSPTELVEIAKKKGLAAISLTDHDCLDGTNEAIEAGKSKGVEILSGVELSSEYGGRDLHILGYGIDPNHDEFQDMLRRFRDTRHSRGLKIIEKLKDLGLEISVEDVMEKSGDGALGRPHIAAVLAEKGLVSTQIEAFDKYIADGGPAYVPKYKMSPQEAIKYIRMAGGLAFMAHPGIFLSNVNDFKGLLGECFDGVEIYHPKHNKKMAETLKAIADEHGMLVSGGSDYHGFTGRDLPLGGIDIPYDVLADIKTRLAKKN